MSLRSPREFVEQGRDLVAMIKILFEIRAGLWKDLLEHLPKLRAKIEATLVNLEEYRDKSCVRKP